MAHPVSATVLTTFQPDMPGYEVDIPVGWPTPPRRHLMGGVKEGRSAERTSASNQGASSQLVGPIGSVNVVTALLPETPPMAAKV